MFGNGSISPFFVIAHESVSSMSRSCLRNCGQIDARILRGQSNVGADRGAKVDGLTWCALVCRLPESASGMSACTDGERLVSPPHSPSENLWHPQCFSGQPHLVAIARTILQYEATRQLGILTIRGASCPCLRGICYETIAFMTRDVASHRTYSYEAKALTCPSFAMTVDDFVLTRRFVARRAYTRTPIHYQNHIK